jgi:hypothetical protein
MTPRTILLGILTLFGLSSCGKPVNGGTSAADGSGRNLLLAKELKGLRVLKQNWTDAEARKFYDTSQGSQLMPYTWWLNLEQEKSETLFSDPAKIRSFGYLPRSKEPTSNPDGLPIGFVKNGVALGMTCAACHTGQINYQGTAWLIDGAPTLADAAALMREMEASLKATMDDPAKFGRFSTGVLGKSPTADAVAALKRELQEVYDRRSQYNGRNLPKDKALDFGPGRLDAFDAIFNEVAVRFAQVPDNATQCDAPVSYPFLWDTPQHDRVQWNGSAPNTVLAGIHIGALGRNVGEVLGVFADVDTTVQEKPLGGYPSSVNTGSLSDLEELLRGLWSPQWPEEFGKLDPALVSKGKALFTSAKCIDCHQEINRTDPNRKIIAIMDDVKTDPSMARNAATRTARSGVFEGRIFVPGGLPRKLEAVEPIGNLLSHLGQRVLVGKHDLINPQDKSFNLDLLADIKTATSTVSTILNDVKIVEGKLHSASIQGLSDLKTGVDSIVEGKVNVEALPAELKEKITKIEGGVDKIAHLAMNDGTAAPAVVAYKYKGRPLNGIWATAPYLHNGSVLNLDELLKPAAERLKEFKVGSREFDPKNVGLVNAGDFTFKTTAQPGNSNAGHEYGVFTAEERAQLVEYMKSL